MARTGRPARPQSVLDAVLRAGGIDIFNKEFDKGGNGAARRARARRELEKQFGPMGQDTFDAIAKRARAAAEVAKRLSDARRKNPLAATEYPETPGDRPRPGVRRHRVFECRVEVHWEYPAGKHATTGGSRIIEVKSSTPFAIGEAQQIAINQVLSMLTMRAVEYDRVGIIDKPIFTAILINDCDQHLENPA